MGAPVTFKDTGISQLIEEHRNEANPLFPIRWNDREFVLASKFINPIFGFAAYHKSSFKLSRFTIEGALRLDYEHAALKYKSFTSTSYAIMQTLPSGEVRHYRYVPILIDEAGRLSRSFWQLLPKLSATYSVPGVDG
ncbi:MAG: TonB-dependent receptor, partial [Muribaculaceae bacterium]|nr:TonB-dependent receptor [Muribaculaceae bacterium]